MTGPTAGDLIELADTGLVIRVEADAQRAGDEFRTGFGKTARDGMHLRAATATETCDIVITNVTLLDPVLGVRTVSVGVRAGRISAIGRAGNPDTLDGVDVVVGTGTTIIPGEGLLATPGAVDTHVHLLSPRVLEAIAVVRGDDGDRAGDRAGVGRGPELAVAAAEGVRRLRPVAGQRRFSGPRLLLGPGAAGGGAGRGRGVRLQGARGSGRAPALPGHRADRGRRVRRAGGAAHRRAERGRLRVRHAGGGRRPDVPRLPRRGLRRRARPERAGTGRPGRRRHLLDQPHAAIRPGRGGRAPRHDRAGARPGPGAGLGAGPGPDPGRHDGGRGAAARPGRHPDHVLRRAGHGPGRGDGAPDVRHGRGDEAFFRVSRSGRQRAGAAVPGQADHQPGGRARAGARGGLGRGGQAGRHRAVGPGLVRRQADAGAEGGRAGLGRDRRPERGDRHRRADRARPAVRGVRRHPGRALGHVRRPGRSGLRR